MDRLNKILLIITLAGLSAFGPFVTDMYLPSLPSLPNAFNTTMFWAQMTMSVCMFGLASGQIVIGPLSDKFGRRGALLFSMWLFVFSSLACVFATNIYLFILLRFLQGVAGAGGIVLSRSISSDKYSGMELAKFLAIIAAVHSIAPVAAPIIGSFTLSFTTWRGVFACLFILGVVLLLLSYRIDESLVPERRSKLSVFTIFKLYGNVLRDKVALFYILQQGSMAIVLFSYIAASPFIFQKVYGFNPMQFSGVFALNAIGIGIGAALSNKFKRRRHAVVFGGSGVFFVTLAIGALVMFGANALAVESLLFSMMLLFGVVAPASAAIVLDSQRANAGTAAALMGALPFLLGSIAIPCTGLGDTLQSFSIMIIIGSSFSITLAFVARAFQKKYGPSTI